MSGSHQVLLMPSGAGGSVGNRVLLLRADGSNGSTTITDSSPQGCTVTAVGNAQISTDQSKYGGSSLKFDGSGDGAVVNGLPDIATSQDFTVETWVYFSTLSGSHDIFSYVGGTTWALYRKSSTGKIVVFSPSGDLVAGTTSVTTGQWYHVAWVRQSSTMRLYIDGVQENSYSPRPDAISWSASNTFRLGNYSGSSEYLDGYLDDFCITDACKYPNGTTFTPPGAL